MKQQKRIHPSALVHFIAMLIACHNMSGRAQTMPLLIVSQPQSVSVGVGGEAKFTVLADGTPPIYYQWQAGGVNLPGETLATVLLTNIQVVQAGYVSVLVSNASGRIRVHRSVQRG